MYLYHATAQRKVESIAENGLHAQSYFTPWEDMADYYADTVEDEGDEAVILAVAIDDLDKTLMSPDLNAVYEPIMSAIRDCADHNLMSEEDIIEAWEQLSEEGRTAEASMNMVGAMKYDGVIEPKHILILDYDELKLLVQPEEPKHSKESDSAVSFEM